MFFSMDIININYSVFIPLLETNISILHILSFDIFEVIDDLNNIFALEIKYMYNPAEKSVPVKNCESIREKKLLPLYRQGVTFVFSKIKKRISSQCLNCYLKELFELNKFKFIIVGLVSTYIIFSPNHPKHLLNVNRKCQPILNVRYLDCIINI